MDWPGAVSGEPWRHDGRRHSGVDEEEKGGALRPLWRNESHSKKIKKFKKVKKQHIFQDFWNYHRQKEEARTTVLELALRMKVLWKKEVGHSNTFGTVRTKLQRLLLNQNRRFSQIRVYRISFRLHFLLCVRRCLWIVKWISKFFLFQLNLGFCYLTFRRVP